MPLNTQPNLANPDAFYQRLVELHQERSEEQSRLIDASLILLLANHIGDAAVLEEAMQLAVRAAEAP